RGRCGCPGKSPTAWRRWCCLPTWPTSSSARCDNDGAKTTGSTPARDRWKDAAMTRTTRVTAEDVEALRGPLTGYCYRLLGAAADTDVAVQETIIRASPRLDQFDPSRARLTTWVHRIATNICLDMLRAASRRALPVDLG